MVQDAAFLGPLRDVRVVAAAVSSGPRRSRRFARDYKIEAAGELPVNQLTCSSWGALRYILKVWRGRPSAGVVTLARENDGDRLHVRRRRPIGRSARSATRRDVHRRGGAWVISRGVRLYSLFPALCTASLRVEVRGRPTPACSTPPKGTAAFLVPVASWLQTLTGS